MPHRLKYDGKRRGEISGEEFVGELKGRTLGNMELFEYLRFHQDRLKELLAQKVGRHLSIFFFEGRYLSRRNIHDVRVPYINWRPEYRDTENEFFVGVRSIADGFSHNHRSSDVAILIHPTWRVWLNEDEAMKWIKILAKNYWQRLESFSRRIFHWIE